MEKKKINMKFPFLATVLFFACSGALAQEKMTEAEIKEYRYIKKNMKYSYTDSVQVVLYDMAYACGECYPNFRIEGVMYVKEDKEQRLRYIGKEIYIEIQSKELATQLQQAKKAQYCYSYIVHGILKQNNYGVMKMTILGGEIRDKWCDD